MSATGADASDVVMNDETMDNQDTTPPPGPPTGKRRREKSEAVGDEAGSEQDDTRKFKKPRQISPETETEASTSHAGPLILYRKYDWTTCIPSGAPPYAATKEAASKLCPSPAPKYVGRVTRSEIWVSAKASLRALSFRTRPQPTYKLALSLELTIKDPEAIKKEDQQLMSPYPFVFTRNLLWLPGRGLAAYIAATDKSADKKKRKPHALDIRLIDGFCELFWCSPAASLHYVGRFRLVEGRYEYTRRETKFIRPEIKRQDPPQHPSRGQASRSRYHFVILEYCGWNDAMVRRFEANKLIAPLEKSKLPKLVEHGFY